MSTIHAYTSPARGHLFPLAAILAQLARRGHRVKVWTLSSELERMRALGVGAEAVAPEIEALPVEDWRATKGSEGVRIFIETLLARAPYEIADFETVLRAETPDLVISDINQFGLPAAAEASGIPWLSFAPYFAFYPDEGIPVFGPGMAPMPGALGRLRDRVLWKAVFSNLDKSYLEPLNEIRRIAGAAPLGALNEIFVRPPRLLYMTVPELEYPRPNLPDSWRFVGPCQWEPAAEAPAWLDEIERPLVLVTASTEFQDDGELISTALAALADEDVSVVATSAANDPAAFTVPANARVERFLPHGPLLERAETVICHGGMGITQKALAAGVPVCTVGWGRDQLESGRRVETAGAGVLLPRKRLSTEALTAAFRRARERRLGAERIALAIADSPGAAGAANEVEQLLPAGVETR